MGIFDIFNRGSEEYKGFKLSNDVDTALQKQLIDRGRGNEVNSLTPDAIKTANVNQTANSTPAMINIGKNSLEPVQETSFLKEFGKINQPENFNKEIIQPAEEAIFSSPTVQAGLENTVGWLNAADEASQGLLKRDDGSMIMTQDLPAIQQGAGAVFHVFKNIGRGEIGTAESVTNGMQWLGVESAAPLSEKLRLWQDAVAPENPTFADNLGAGIGSAVVFFLPGAGAMKATEAIGLFSPRLAALFGNSVMTAFEALAEAGDTWQTLKDQGKSEQEAGSAATKTFWANAVLIGLTNQLAYFNKVKGLKKLLISSPTEGLQEFGQQVIQNLSTGKTEAQAFDGAFEAGAIGMIIGGILGGAELEGSDINEVGIKNPTNNEVSQIAVPNEFYRLETKEGEKYFETKQEATDYASANNAEGSYAITQQGTEEAMKILSSGSHTFFPFQNGVSADQVRLNTSVSDIQVKTGLSKSEAGQVLDTIKTLMMNERAKNASANDIFKQAVDQVKMETGQTPSIIEQAVAEASRNVTPAAQELPATVYHQTNIEADIIREGGFKMGKNSAFGSAAFFGEKSNKLYGDNQVAVSPSEFKLKTFKTIKEQQAYIAENGGGKLADAIRAEGKYDGFIIPNPQGNVYGITNNEKLDAKLKSQQYVTTEEAKVISQSFKFIEELGLPVNAVEKILTASGKEAFGKYYNGVISFVQNPHKTTLPHEAFHAFLDLMLNDSQKQTVLDEVKRRYAGKRFTNQEAEEQAAEDFAKYYTQKFDNPTTAKAPSSKIKQFFDWFIDQLNLLVGKGDLIARLYKDIETKKPGIFKKEAIRRKIARSNYNLEELQKEYYQNPDALTTKFLENIDVKNREVAGYDFLKNLLKSKSLPLKETERNLIDDILDTQFKGEKKINMQDFRDAVRLELLPLQVITSETYADYGSSNVELDGLDHTTHIYNTPFKHGYSGHFSNDFTNRIPASNIEIKQIPGQEKWAVIKKGVDLTEANVAENVYNIANSEQEAKDWIERKTFAATTVDVGLSGLFGHTRVWDDRNVFQSKITKAAAIEAFNNNQTVYAFDGNSEHLIESVEDINEVAGYGETFRIENDNAEENASVRYIAEIQSDAFQNAERISGVNKNITSINADIASIKEKISNFENDLVLASKPGFERDQEYKDSIQKIVDEYKGFLEKETKRLSAEEEKLKLETSKPERQFFQYKNVWHERLIREEIRQAAMDNVSKLRFPTPYTIAKIEGYLAEEGQIPEGTSIGDTFEYAGQDYILLKDNNDYMGENTGISAPYKDVRVINDYNTLRQEDFDNELNDLIEEIKSSDDITDIYNLNNFGELDAKELKSLKKKVDNDEDVSDVLEPIVEKVLDDRYTDVEGYASYWNDATGEEYSYATEDDRVIILNKNDNVETFGIGATEANKENFNYEEDLDSSEQKTVARFYDKQVGRYLAKLRKQNLKTVTDDNGHDWLETDILPEDKTAVEAFQTKPTEAPLKRTGAEVADYVDSIEQEMDDKLPDYLRNSIEGQDFTLQSVKIKDLIAKDADLRSYVEANDQRYDEYHDGDVDLPIVIGQWLDKTYGVLDGYNRTLTKLQNGDEFIEAWVSEIGAPKYQEMTPSQISDLQYRRQQALEKNQIGEFNKESGILNAREADLTYSNPEQESGYQAFKNLAKRRSWVLNNGTDNAMLKQKLPAINVDNTFFSGATEMTNDELLEMFKDRYYQEQQLKIQAKEKTPTEIAAAQEKVANKVVKAATVGRKITLKNAMNVVKGIEKPITITAKETVLLKNRLRDMVKASKAGYSIGRAEMRADLNLAFAGQLQYAKMIKKAILAYAQELPVALRGTMLNSVADASTVSDMAKAFARIDQALKNADTKEQLQGISKVAKKVKKAMTTGKGIAVDYQKRIADILNNYNLKNPTAATIEKLNSLSDYIAQHPEANIPDHLIKRLDTLKKISAKEMTAESLADLNDLITRLWGLGELKLAMKGKYDERFKRQSVDKLLMTTVNVDNSKVSTLSLLHAPRVADVFDGFRQYKGYNVQLQKKINRSVSGSVITTRNIVEDVASTIATIKKEFTREEQAAMAFKMAIDQKLFTQAQSLISAYADEFGWKSEADIKITPEIQMAIDTMRGKFNETVDYLAAVYEEIENKPFIKNDNYFPNKYDRSFDDQIDIEAPTVGQMIDFSTKQINKGFTFARMKGVKKVLRIDVFNVFAEAVAEQQYYMRVQPVLNEISSIVNDRAYQNRIGKVGVEWWDLYLKSVANKGKIPNFGVWKHIDPTLRAIKINLSNAVLGYKIGSALIQPTAIIDAYAYVYLNHGALAANALIMRLAGTLTLPGYAKSIIKKSVALQIRTGGELTIREMQEEPARNKLVRAYQKGGMWLLRTMDELTASAVQQTMYKHFKGKGMTAGEAQQEADFVMNLTQGSSEIADLPLILSSGELARTILTFQTFVLNRWGIIAHDVVRSAILHGRIDRKLKGLIALFLISMAGGLENFLRTKAQQFTTGIEYPERLNFWQQSLLTTPETIPVVGSILTSIVEYNKGFSLPITRVIETLIQGGQGIIAPAGETSSKREENRKKGALKFAEAIATFAGISGTSQLADFIQRLVIPPALTQSAGGTNNKTSTPEMPKLPALPKAPKMPTPPKR